MYLFLGIDFLIVENESISVMIFSGKITSNFLNPLIFYLPDSENLVRQDFEGNKLIFLVTDLVLKLFI